MKFIRTRGLQAVVAACLLAPAAAAISSPSAGAASTQGGSISLTPPIVQNGVGPASARRAELAGTVSFTPVRTGRPVVIQRRLPGGSWSKWTTARQDGQGQVRFVGPARTGSRWYRYRGVAKRYDGLPSYRTGAKDASVWSLTFDDQFSGEQLSDRWRVRGEGSYARGNRACSASHPDAVEVGDGRVALSVEHDSQRQAEVGPCNSYYGRDDLGEGWFRNGHISTAHDFSFRYGTAAARVKFDRNDGAHGAFWLQSTVADRSGVGPLEDGAEIDTAEYFGESFRRGDVYHFIHYRDAADVHHKVPGAMRPVAAVREALEPDDDWFKRYHVFSVQWSDSGYLFRIDGVPTLQIAEGVSGVEEFLVLSMLTSDWELSRLDPAALPVTLQVDWVRVWQRADR